MPPNADAGSARDLSTVLREAAHIAQLKTLAEREAFFAAIPPEWQSMVAHQAKVAIAIYICDEIPEVEARRAALCAVPAAWMDEVRWHVTRFWRTRAERAERKAKQAAKGEAQGAAA